jgi:hypothetical protein
LCKFAHTVGRAFHNLQTGNISCTFTKRLLSDF